MRRTTSSGRLETQSAVSLLAEELQRLATESAARAEGAGAVPVESTAPRPDLAQALDATWERSDAVYRALATE